MEGVNATFIILILVRNPSLIFRKCSIRKYRPKQILNEGDSFELRNVVQTHKYVAVTDDGERFDIELPDGNSQLVRARARNIDSSEPVYHEIQRNVNMVRPTVRNESPML